MITQTESGLEVAEYAALSDVKSEHLTADIVLQRYGPVWANQDNEALRTGKQFDATIAGTFLLRAYLNGVHTIEIRP